METVMGFDQHLSELQGALQGAKDHDTDKILLEALRLARRDLKWATELALVTKQESGARTRGGGVVASMEEVFAVNQFVSGYFMVARMGLIDRGEVAKPAIITQQQVNEAEQPENLS
jgi:hypothetical protein